MAGDGNGVWRHAAARFDETNGFLTTFTGSGWSFGLDDDFFLVVVVVTLVVVVEGVEDAVSCTFDSSAEGVVVALVVVVAHITLLGGFVGGASFRPYFFDRPVVTTLVLDVVGGLGVGVVATFFGWSTELTTLVFDVVGRVSPATVLSLGDV